MNGNADGLRWELLFADERSEEVLTRLTASAPDNALSFVMARPAEEFFPVEELQACATGRAAPGRARHSESRRFRWLRAAERSVARSAASRWIFCEGRFATDHRRLPASPRLIAKAFVRSGDTVVLENPTYPGASAVFNGVHARCLGVPVRTHAEPDSPLGIDLEALESTLAPIA